MLAAGGRALEQGDLEAAEARFSEAAALVPESGLAWFGLSEVAANRGDVLEALRLARQAERWAPERPEPVFAVGRHLARLGRSDEALVALSRFRALEPERPEGYLLAASLLRQLGRVEEALQMLEVGAADAVADPRLAEERVLILLTAGEVERAIEVAEGAVDQFTDSGDLRGALGLALAADPERRGEADSWLSSALESDVLVPEKIHLELASLLTEQGETDRAVEHLHAAAALDPSSSEVQYRLGAALRNSGDLEGAREALGRYQKLKGAEQRAAQARRDAGTRFNEAQSLANESRLPEALEKVEVLLLEHPKDDRALALKGKVLFSMGRREAGLAAIIAARQAAENQIEYHYLEGMILLQLGRPVEAELPLRRALALDAELAEGHALLGMMLSSQERYEEAVEQFERAFELGVEGTGFRLGFAEALRGAGREAESMKQMEAYRRLSEG